MSCLSPVFFGRQRRSGFTVLPRHRHEGSYLALVMSGGYEEAGDRGRHWVRAGDIVLHGAFEAHLNRYDAARSEVLNIILPTWTEPTMAVMQTADPDTAIRLAEHDPRDAATFLLATMQPKRFEPGSADWPDELAAALLLDPHLRLQHWARRRACAAWRMRRCPVDSARSSA